jgi:ubiquinone/menaquinone biosynthesis C-methylase UbiE
MWQGETNTLLGYSGAKALWMVEHGAITQTPEHIIEHDTADTPTTTGTESESESASDSGSDSGSESGGGVAALERLLPVLRCVACGGALRVQAGTQAEAGAGAGAEAGAGAGAGGGGEGLVCGGCRAWYPVQAGFVDVAGGQDEREDPLMARFHEKWLRPAFMRLIGGNWAGEVTFADENRWVTEFMRPAPGPIVDLGPGAGITTKTLADTYGAERVIAVDASAAMLTRLARRVPGTAAIRASATQMPFPDASIGAINCWNMLHYFDDKTAALTEIARVLQPGGSLTLMDLMPDPDPIARHFQNRMGQTVTRKLFGPTQIGDWLTHTGMTIQDIYLPAGNFMILRAQRTTNPPPTPPQPTTTTNNTNTTTEAETSAESVAV